MLRIHPTRQVWIPRRARGMTRWWKKASRTVMLRAVAASTPTLWEGYSLLTNAVYIVTNHVTSIKDVLRLKQAQVQALFFRRMKPGKTGK